MFKIIFIDKATNEIKENTYNVLNEEKALELFRRAISINPSGYIFKEIINIEEQKEIDIYFENKEKAIKETSEEFKKAVKNLIKKPYTSTKKIAKKSISINSNWHNDIEKAINEIISEGVLEDKLTVLINKYKIIVEPTKEYYISAE